MTQKNKTAQSAQTAPHAAQTNPALQTALAQIRENKIVLAVIQNGQIIYTAQGQGIAPLLQAVQGVQNVQTAVNLRGGILADKIVGKAAAMLAVYGGAAEVYGCVMSRSAQEYLQQHGVKAGCDTQADVIENRAKTGPCPIEQAVREIDSAQQAPAVVAQTLQRLRAAQQAKK